MTSRDQSAIQKKDKKKNTGFVGFSERVDDFLRYVDLQLRPDPSDLAERHEHANRSATGDLELLGA
jgi:hypothetical protein